MIVRKFEELTEEKNSAVLCFHFQDEEKILGTPPNDIDGSELESLLGDLMQENVYEGKRGTIRSVRVTDHPVDWVCFCGLGEKEKMDGERFRRVIGDAARSLSEDGVEHVVVLLPETDQINTEPYRSGRAFYEGTSLATYRFDLYKSDDPSNESLKTVQYVTSDGEEEIKAGISDATLYAEGTEYARDLANEPPGIMNPDRLAEEAKNLESDRIHVNVMREDRIRELGMEPTLGVSAGSTVEPAQIELRYEPEEPADPEQMVAVIGKGITFDSGGLNLKGNKGMMNMKFDMAGAASVLGVFRVLEELAPDVRVLGMLACSENMTGPDAQKMRDVVTSYGGKTIEITNTDAEGRLVLSDALGYAVDQGATEICDIATLTGSVVTALGSEYAGLMGNDEQLVKRLKKAAKISGERVWELPLVEEYNSYLDSPVADLRNTGTKREGGAIVAGLFLQNFVEDVPWVHLDIASTGWKDDTSDYRTEGGTGYPVRTLLDFIRESSG